MCTFGIFSSCRVKEKDDVDYMAQANVKDFLVQKGNYDAELSKEQVRATSGCAADTKFKQHKKSNSSIFSHKILIYFHLHYYYSHTYMR